MRASSPLIRVAAIALTTPVDDQISEMRMIYHIEKPPLAPRLHPLLRLVLRRVTEREVGAEVAIWDKKMYVSRPVFLPHETGIRTLRSWYAQFYDAQEGAPNVHTVAAQT